MTLFLAIAITLITYMVIGLVKPKHESMNTWELALLGSSPVIGVLIVRLALVFCTKPKNIGCGAATAAILKFWTCEDYVKFHKERRKAESEEAQITDASTMTEVQQEQEVMM